METIENMIEEVLARHFTFYARLHKDQQKQLVDIFHEDVISGDSPEEVREIDLYDHIEEHVALVMSNYIEDVVGFYS